MAGGIRKGAGRKKLDVEKVMINKTIRFTPEEWHEITVAALLCGLTPSAYIRRKALS